MRALAVLIITIATAAPAAGSVVVARGAGEILVAADGGIRSFSARDLTQNWQRPGVGFPMFAAVSETGDVAFVDPVARQVALVRDEDVQIVALENRPVAAAFAARDLFLVSRGGPLTRVDAKGGVDAVPLGAGSPLLAATGGAVFVYDQIDGRIERFDPVTLESRAIGTTSPFASELLLAGDRIHLTVPRAASLIELAAGDLTTTAKTAAGAVPVDLAIESAGGPAYPAVLIVADPSSKRLWRIEGRQSFAEAFGRGFVRGLLGIGLRVAPPADLPTGADRVFRAEGRTWAFDTVTGTLYDATGETARKVASGLRWTGFAIVGTWLIAERDGELRKLPLAAENG